jgi:Sigma-54 interaction domain
MRFPSQERFLQYCVSKRRTYLRVLFERRNPRGFFELWKGEFDFSRSRFEVDGVRGTEASALGRELRWLLLQDLHQVVRSVVPDLSPVPPNVIEALPGAMHQVRIARSMMIAGGEGAGKEQLAILLHVLAGRPGALVRVAAAELGSAGGTPTRQLMPERGSVFISDFEQVDPSAQEDLLVFLNGDARRRDLLFFVATRAEPRELVSRHGVRRDLFVRASQTEVRLPSLQARPHQAAPYVADVVFDLVRLAPERLPELRSEARELGESWSASLQGVSKAYDFFAEALSYVMWREKARVATALLAEPWRERLATSLPAGGFPALCASVAEAFDRHTSGGVVRAERPAPDLHVAPAEADAPAPRPRPAPAGAADDAAVFVPTEVSRDQLLRLYYQALLAEERGDLRRVAARAGRRLRSLHAELARLGVRIPRELAHPHPRDEL